MGVSEALTGVLAPAAALAVVAIGVKMLAKGVEGQGPGEAALGAGKEVANTSVDIIQHGLGAAINIAGDAAKGILR